MPEKTEKKEKNKNKKDNNEEEKQEEQKEEKQEEKEEEEKEQENQEEKQEENLENKKEENEKKDKEEDQEKREIPEFSTGDLIRVHQKVKKSNAKGDVETFIETFKGIVISKKGGSEAGATFTVRRETSGGVGVEKIFPLHLPSITKIEVLKKHKTRRSKLYYLRDQKSKLKEQK